MPKVCPARDSNPGRSESNDLLHKVAKIVASNPKGLEFFLDCQLWEPITLKPFELKNSFDNPFNICLELEAQGHSMTYSGSFMRSK